jgi:hypothetical protein
MAAPRRYTCRTSDRNRSVFMSAISRMTRGNECGTATSVAHMRGTSFQPSFRTAAAGNSLVRSGVIVKKILITSSIQKMLRLITSLIRIDVDLIINSVSSASTWIAPRTAKIVLISPIFMAHNPSEAYSGQRYRSCETHPELQRSVVNQDR